MPLSRPLLALLVLCFAVAGAPRAEAAVVARLELEPGSTLAEEGLEPVALLGSITLRFDAWPPVAPAGFEIVDLVADAGLLSFALDPEIESPGLGVLFADGSFLVPTLFLLVDTHPPQMANGLHPLAVPDVEGTLDTSDPALLGLETSLEVETPDGLVSVEIVAVPEPGAAALACAAAPALAALRAQSSRRASGTRLQRSGSGWPSRSRKISRKR